ncbi:MAG: nucleotidyltransferase domain-containing protein [Ktedonobacteraceae bacterium]
MILGTQIVGLYLYGSLSLGDFDPASNDVDFLVVTEGELPEETLEQLRVVSSKPQAAVRAQEAYPQWRPIIERSLTWRSQHEKDDLTETLAFLREALKLALGICNQHS